MELLRLDCYLEFVLGDSYIFGYFWFFIRSDAAKMSSQKLIRVICIRAMAFRWTRRVIFISFVASVLVWLSCCKLDFYEHRHLSAAISIDGSVKSILCTVTVFYV